MSKLIVRNVFFDSTNPVHNFILRLIQNATVDNSDLLEKIDLLKAEIDSIKHGANRLEMLKMENERMKLALERLRSLVPDLDELDKFDWFSFIDDALGRKDVGVCYHNGKVIT